MRSAQVYSWLGRDGRSRSLDIFWVRGPEDAEQRRSACCRSWSATWKVSWSDAVDPAELERRALSGRAPNRADPTTRFATEVNVDNKSREQPHDHRGHHAGSAGALVLPVERAATASGLSIWFAKINTEGERVIDVFYVSSGSGQKVVDAAEIERIRQAVINAVKRLEARNVGPGVMAAAAS